MVSRGIDLIYGGGRVGLMGAVADAVLGAGGAVEGVIPRALVNKEIAHQGLTKLHVVETMHQRKALMADLADAFVMLPGGFGSWDEFCEIITWLQLGIHRKPCGVLNIDGYYDGWLAQVAHAVREGFIREQHASSMVVATTPEEMLEKLEAIPMHAVSKWVELRSDAAHPNDR
jgi:uncharacterized protein (TIGR00730 family)